MAAKPYKPKKSTKVSKKTIADMDKTVKGKKLPYQNQPGASSMLGVQASDFDGDE